MSSDAAVVFDKSELVKSIHEEAHARAGSADHLRKGFLRDLVNVSPPEGGDIESGLISFNHRRASSRFRPLQDDH
jgi:hypothetical protein